MAPLTAVLPLEEGGGLDLGDLSPFLGVGIALFAPFLVTNFAADLVLAGVTFDAGFVAGFALAFAAV